MYLLKMLLKLKCRGFKKNNNWKKYFMILNSNSNLGIQTMEFQILRYIRRPKYRILKLIDFKSKHFKSLVQNNPTPNVAIQMNFKYFGHFVGSKVN